MEFAISISINRYVEFEFHLKEFKVMWSMGLHGIEILLENENWLG